MNIPGVKFLTPLAYIEKLLENKEELNKENT